jgi:hypothetical protein
MRYEQIKACQSEEFKRLTGVSRETYEQMLEILQSSWREFGRPTKLSRADQLLLTLMYWREYRTQFHIAHTYGVSEATVCRTIARVEEALMRSGKFRLPGVKALQPSDTRIEVVLVDATEQAIERLQKNNNEATTAARRSGIPKKRKS